MSDDGPAGYHLLLPPGWQGFSVDDAGLAAVQALMSARFKEAGRPDLDAQARRMLRQQWDGLRKQRAQQVFMRVEETEGTLLPMSIALRKHAVRDGGDFAQSLAQLTACSLDRIETPIGPVHRGERSVEGRGELREARSITVVYGVPLPPPHETRGLALFGTVVHLADTDPELVRGHVEILDSVVETVRWR